MSPFPNSSKIHSGSAGQPRRSISPTASNPHCSAVRLPDSARAQVQDSSAPHSAAEDRVSPHRQFRAVAQSRPVLRRHHHRHLLHHCLRRRRSLSRAAYCSFRQVWREFIFAIGNVPPTISWIYQKNAGALAQSHLSATQLGEEAFCRRTYAPLVDLLPSAS